MTCRARKKELPQIMRVHTVEETNPAWVSLHPGGTTRPLACSPSLRMHTMRLVLVLKHWERATLGTLHLKAKWVIILFSRDGNSNTNSSSIVSGISQ